MTRSGTSAHAQRKIRERELCLRRSSTQVKPGELTAASMKMLAEKHMSDTDFEVLQIRGDDSTEDKERTLNAFRQAPRALLTNARALAEGVDVPVIDMVAFMTTKQSEVDIMQSAGRAMRKDRDRDDKVAYILLPVFIPSRDVEKSSSDVSAAKDEGQTSDAPSGVDKREHISTNGKISNDRASRALGPRASEKRHARRSTASDERDGTVTAAKGASTTNPLATASEAPVDGRRIGPNTSPQVSTRRWCGTRKDADETSILGSAEGYASVLAVIKAFCENDESLQDATKQLRYARGAGLDGTSPDARVKAAEAEFKELIRVECLGGQGSCVSASDIERAVRTVILHATTSSWDEYFGALERYKEGPGNGDANCVKTYVDPDTGLNLGSWLSTPASLEEAEEESARSRARRASGTSGREVGQHHTWDEYFGALERYKEGPGNGDPNCAHTYVDPDTGLKLGVWLTTQRQLKKRKKNPLDPARVERLERLGVCLDPHDSKWDEYFGALERYKEGPGNGDANCPYDYVDPETGLKLGSWLSNQRKLKKRKKNPLDPERVERLERLGVWWSSRTRHVGRILRRVGAVQGRTRERRPELCPKLRRPRHRPESRPRGLTNNVS